MSSLVRVHESLWIDPNEVIALLSEGGGTKVLLANKEFVEVYGINPDDMASRLYASHDESKEKDA